MTAVHGAITRCAPALLSALLAGCGGGNIEGDTDASDDPATDTSRDGTDAMACGDCDDGDPCTVDSCDASSGECVHDIVDADGDGHGTMVAADGITECAGDDCDDTDASIHPGAPEVCLDGVDQDCDTIVDGPRAMLSTVHLKALDAMALNPVVAWTGSEFLAAWNASEDIATMAQNVYLARVDLDGELVGGEVMPLTDDPESEAQFPSLAFTGSEIGILYTSGSIHGTDADPDLNLMRMDPTGVPIATTARIEGDGILVHSGDLVWTGSEYGVFWSDGRNGPCPSHMDCAYDSYFTRTDPTGVRIGSDVAVASSDSDTEAMYVLPDPVWTGSEFVASNYGYDFDTGEATGSFVTRLSPLGEAVAFMVPVDPPPGSAVWTGSELAATLASEEAGNQEVYLHRWTPEVTPVGDPVRITDAPHYSGNSGTAWTGSLLGVGWMDGRDTSCDGPIRVAFDCDYHIYFNVLDPVGTKLYEDVRITLDDAWRPLVRMVWTGSEFGLVWMGGTGGSDLHVAFDRVAFCD